MSFEKRLKEFYECDIKDKYTYKTNAKFKDGLSMGYWFNKKVNKEIIYSSDEQLCIDVKNAHTLFLKEQKEASVNRKVSFKYCVEIKNERCKEFLEYPDFEKFNIDSKLCFSNGKIMSKWFLENKNHILASKNDLCIEIVKQYRIYLNNLKKSQERKRKLNYEKNKHIFYREKGLKKFDTTSRLKFPDGSFMGEWFMMHKDYILSSNGPLESAIKDNYELFISMNSLKREFLEEENFEKFDIYGYVKFSTGALMNVYWEVYQDDILNSECILDKKIAKQYKKYLFDVGNELFTDDEINFENKVKKKV